MSKYIDAEKLIAEIERLSFNNCKEFGNGKDLNESFGGCEAYKKVLSIITSLQQDQPEESIAKEAIQLVFEEKLTPFKDGNQWSFLLGHNVQEGVCGFGDTILDAAINFYKDYSTTRIHIGELKKTMEQPEVDLEKEITRWLDEGDITDTRFDDYGDSDIEITARHFYELGLNARKEE